MTKTMANSPAVLEAYLGFSGALGAGVLDPKLREQIALITAQYNHCDYCLAADTTAAQAAGKNQAMTTNTTIMYKIQQVEGVKIFYREAGSRSTPTVVLLHGFPSSSHMYRDLIPLLAGQYHVVAADMPGFGYSDQPSPEQFAYTFDHVANVMDRFLDAIGVTKYSIYIQDYGSPIGFRLFVKHPERIQAIISQNGNAYEEGLSPFWAESIIPYWNSKNPETEKKVRDLLTLETTRFQYTQGFRHPERVSPDSYTFDQLTLDRPGNQEIQLALFYDYQNNVKQYPVWHEALRNVRPPVLAVWGKNDPIFLPAGAEAFRRDVPAAEIHFVDSGHFALEEDAGPIASYMLSFLNDLFTEQISLSPQLKNRANGRGLKPQEQRSADSSTDLRRASAMMNCASAVH